MKLLSYMYLSINLILLDLRQARTTMGIFLCVHSVTSMVECNHTLSD